MISHKTQADDITKFQNLKPSNVMKWTSDPGQALKMKE